MMTYRPATREDILQFMDSIPATCRAYAAEEDSVVYGIGGVYYDQGRVFAFSQARPDMKPRDKVRGAHKIMDIVRKVEGPVWAIRGDFESADRVLKHLGFEPVGDDGYYIWRNIKWKWQ